MQRVNGIGLMVLAGALAMQAQAGIWMPTVFGDHMVLQAERPVQLWGKAEPGERLTVELLSSGGEVLSSATGMTGEDRAWRVELPPVAAGLRGRLRIAGPVSGERVFEDVLTGEVWLLSGQSNMRWTVAKSANAEAEIAAADFPEIRLFMADLNPASVPLGNLKSTGWKVCSPETVGDFSGAGYYFGRDLHQRLARPVGLVLSAVGGTPIQAWTPMEAMDAHPATAHIRRDFEAYYAQPPEQRRKARGTWIYGATQQMGPARLYNGMIHPLIPFTFRGIAWCQGEANSKPGGGMWDGPEVYRVHFPMMIQAWREAWGPSGIPFLYVELSNYREPQQTPVSAEEEHHWGPIREAQATALKLPEVYAVPTIDIGEADDIHYKNKQTAGARLALAALGAVYAQVQSPYLSPRYQSHRIEGRAIRICFSDAQGLHTDDGQNPRAFALCGADGVWHWANAVIESEEVVVSHPEIEQPVAVRHAWASNPDVNVYNGAGLPLSSFRTDGE